MPTSTVPLSSSGLTAVSRVIACLLFVRSDDTQNLLNNFEAAVKKEGRRSENMEAVNKATDERLSSYLEGIKVATEETLAGYIVGFSKHKNQ
jgi:hypothetical protein